MRARKLYVCSVCRESLNPWLTGVIELRIHKDIERGDNDTIKNPKGKGGVVKIGGA